LTVNSKFLSRYLSRKLKGDQAGEPFDAGTWGNGDAEKVLYLSI
jgi:hypothetical protein